VDAAAIWARHPVAVGSSRWRQGWHFSSSVAAGDADTSCACRPSPRCEAERLGRVGSPKATPYGAFGTVLPARPRLREASGEVGGPKREANSFRVPTSEFCGRG
jgi:hypothetical protein